ncbi:hypothetical protein A33M_4416 [Rhodovulum sp. PH10]|uniref:hypothetical protein n=1 Tax=Rhodovulum sp. PH10 TaxID=1187851 RepID=UPI00027C2E48|nr:hypothetical protein [Rhodovulum sp. PH10]EJW10440.1 hypothetical protein A33M_4416 [Rhodovulum sp. PH10]
MSTAIGSSTAYSGFGSGAYTQSSAGSKTSAQSATTSASAQGSSGAGSSQAGGDAATSLTLSAEARAYLAAMSTKADTSTVSASDRAAAMRVWLDGRYETLGISSALVDGQPAVDFSSQERAALATVAANTDDLFTADEQKAAETVLQQRFDAAMQSRVVLARHSGDYASLYQAAADYLNAAGPEERSTATWVAQSKAVAAGLAVAKANFGKAPTTGDAADPVRALLDHTTTADTGSTDADTDISKVAENARKRFDAQTNAARDAGQELVFDAGRKTGRMVDLGAFDNRELAAVAQNQDGLFSAEEVRAARTELNGRGRSAMLSALTGSGTDAYGRSAALLDRYAEMSPEERSVLGIGDDFVDTVLENYRLIASIQKMLDGSGPTSAVGALF